MSSERDVPNPPDSTAESAPPTIQRRLWTPWRMKYVGGDAGEVGCIFCNRLAADNDVESLIVHRGQHAFLMMNLFPYNTGHVMIIPNRHVADVEDLGEYELMEMARLMPTTTRALRRVLKPAGFNLGMNIGAMAGAGVADHLHQHVVPRWQGDANFMPIIAGTVVVPELIPATYAKLRAEFERPKTGFITLIIFCSDKDRVLIERSQALPRASIDPNQAIFRTSGDAVHSLVRDADLAGWAGTEKAGEPGPIAFAYLTTAPALLSPDVSWMQSEVASEQLTDPDDKRALQNALKLDLSIIPAPPG